MTDPPDVAPAGLAPPVQSRVTDRLSRLTGRAVDVELVTSPTEAELLFWSFHFRQPRYRLLHWPITVELPPDWTVGQVSRAVRSVLCRHTRLRSVFPIVDDRVVRAVLSMGEIDRRAGLRADDGAVATQCDEIVLAPTDADAFDIQTVPPFRWEIVTTRTRTVLFCRSHHVVLDAASAELLAEELTGALAGVDRPRQSRDDDSEPSEQPDPVRRNTEYWYDVLREPPPGRAPLSVRADPGAPSHFRVLFTLCPDTRRSMTETAAAQSATVAMLLLAYLSVVLARLTGQTEHIFSCPFNNRRSARHLREVSCRETVLYPRLAISSGMTMSEVVALVRMQVLDGMKHSDYSYWDLGDLLMRARYNASLASQVPLDVLAGSPLVDDIAYTHVLVPESHRAVQDSVAPVATASGERAKAKLSILDSRTSIIGSLAVDRRYFSQADARAFAQSLVMLCRGSGPVMAQRVADVSVAGPEPSTEGLVAAVAGGCGPSAVVAAAQARHLAPGATAGPVICNILSEVCGHRVEPTDMFVARGGSVRHLPAIVARLLEHGLPIPPMDDLFDFLPVDRFVAAVAGTRVSTPCRR